MPTAREKHLDFLLRTYAPRTELLTKLTIALIPENMADICFDKSVKKL